MDRLIILDRDGVINQDSDAYIKSLDEWHPLDGAVDAIAKLNHCGWTVAVATNQSGIARGYYTLDTLNAIHDRMSLLIQKAGGYLAAIEYCPHLPSDECACRKPKPGMLTNIIDHLRTDEDADRWMVGDSLTDIQAGIAARCRTVLVLTGKGSRFASEVRRRYPDTWICHDLAAFAERLISESRPSVGEN
ncbi:D-glycero-beta-D-manno-heptose 1,7-bisphosphate 7-phosphatase [Salinicola rhizosphaerae]